MRIVPSLPAGLLLLFSALQLDAARVHPIEQRLRSDFPSVSIDASATFENADAIVVGATVVSGLHARFADSPGATLKITYRRSYNDHVVAELGEQRVVLRAINTRPALGEAGNGTLIYQDAYPSVDAIEVPRGGRSEELLLLRDARAPLTYDYEIVEMRGVSAIVMDGGAIRFARVAEVPRGAQIAGGRFTQTPNMLQIDRPWVVDARGRRSETHARWTVIRDGATPKILRLTVSTEGLVYPLLVDPSFSVAGNLADARFNHTATLLQNGKVLFVGGQTLTEYTARSELYDPASGTFGTSGSLATGRVLHTATLLPDGKVLIVGGSIYSAALASAELYDPATGTFTATGSLGGARYMHSATLLQDGKVLIAGGRDLASHLGTAELYDMATGTFTTTGSLPVNRERSLHTATLLPNGKVLLAGGINSFSVMNSANLYDPTTGLFSNTGNMSASRHSHTATLLATGNVLIAGGHNGVDNLNSAEVYSPGTGTFTSTGSLGGARDNHTATLLPNGQVLITGGVDFPTSLSSAELYDVSGTFSATSTLAAARGSHTATQLPNGTVLIAGGNNDPAAPLASPVASAEVYDPPANATFSAAGTAGMVTPRDQHKATLLPDGRVLMVGGRTGSTVLAEAEIFNPSTGFFTTTGGLATARYSHTATLLTNGKVMVAGGYGTSSNLSSVELYDPSSGNFSLTGSLAEARYGHQATLLPDGEVLISGGSGNIGELTSAELYDPVSGTFSATGSLINARLEHTATLLPNGKVLIAGGFDGTYLSSAELYDPLTGTFTATGSLATARHWHTATLLPNGKVLIAGGFNGGYLASAQLYDPVTGTFSATGSLAVARYYNTATLLPSGRVLIAGGYDGAAIKIAELYDPLTGTFGPTTGFLNAKFLHTATLLLNGRVLVAIGPLITGVEIYDPGLGIAELRRPSITTAPSTLVQPAAITLSGTKFRGDSEGSDGSSQNSATNYPLLQLQRVDNDQILFVRSASPFSNTAFTSTVLKALPNGAYRASIVTNGIASIQFIILVTGAAAPNAPSFLLATSTNNTTVAVVWAPVDGAGTYQLYRSSLAAPYAVVLTTTGTSATDVGLTPSRTYLYKVIAIGSAGASPFSAVDLATTYSFSDANLSGALIRTYHIYQLRITVDAVRAAAGLPAGAYTDPTLTAGTTLIKRAHVAELRAALDEGRSVIGVPAISYTDPAIVAGTTVIKAAHVLQLRAGTQ